MSTPFFGRYVKFLTNLSYSDLKEAFTIGDCVHDSEQVDFYQSLYQHPHSSPLPSIPRSQNIWPKPSSAPGFREGMYAYYREIFPVAMKLVEIFGVALGVDSGCHENDDENENENGGDGGLEKDFQWPIWGMRALHYPPSWGEEEVEGEGEDGDEERMGLGAHKDFSWVTLVLQDEVGGLEVLNSEGKWIDVPPREGTLVVNVGQVSFFSPFLFSHFFLFSFSPLSPTKSQSQSQISQHPYPPSTTS